MDENTARQQSRREVPGHHVTSEPGLIIGVLDEPGHGGACHDYMVEAGEYPKMLHIRFQNGPVPIHGINGVTNEALLAIVADRLAGFQSGPYACKSNELALNLILSALYNLNQRTLERMQAGIEGTHQTGQAEEDFLAGKAACDLRGETGCEACQ